MRRFRKNKLLVLVISVTILSVVYFVVQKAIDNYNFGTNQDIVSADSEEDEEVDVVLEEAEEGRI